MRTTSLSLKLAATLLGANLALAHAGPVRHPARIAHVLDVSTYIVDVELDGQTTRITLALTDISAPKIYGPGCERIAARQAKSFAQDILRPQDRVVVSNLGRRGERFVGDIEFDGRDLREVLLKFRQVAQAGAPQPWCSVSGSTDAPT